MNPKSFNDLSNTFDPIEDCLKHGMNPLHAYIRFFEFLLHIAYKKDIKSWQARGSVAKGKVAKAKKAIQEDLWQEMNLRVDFPLPGGSGTSNDGNTARRAFANYEQLSEILGIDVELIRRFRIILISINHNFPIDADKFEEYCKTTAKIYVEKYSWYCMSQSVHKILIHGKDIIKYSLLPIGMYSEQAGESRNKIYKHDRQFHARKTSRSNTL